MHDRDGDGQDRGSPDPEHRARDLQNGGSRLDSFYRDRSRLGLSQFFTRISAAGRSARGTIMKRKSYNAFIWLHVIVVLLGLSLTATASWSQRQKVTSTPRGVGAQFGNAVAMSGST